MAQVNLIIKRYFSLSGTTFGKKNFRKFPLFGFRGTEEFRKRQKENPDPELPVYTYGVKNTYYVHGGKKVEVPELIPELIVPNLTDCQLKPYVSYKTDEVVQTEFTAKDLFDAVYSQKIADDYRNSKLNEDGQSLSPNEFEQLTPDEAKKLARQTGSDIFSI